MVDADHNLAQELLRDILVGKHIVALETPVSTVWNFKFAGAHLNVGVPWRILDDESIRLGSCDHDHKFGLSHPVNAVEVAMELLLKRQLEHLSLDRKTADLKLAFSGSFILDIFNQSSGWEGWNLASDNGRQVIALGGGDIAIFGK